MESLQQLEMNHCRILTLLSEDKIKCSNLKNLTLRFVTVSESALDTLISCFPRIETISLQCCIGFRCIRVPKVLPNLLSLSILSCIIEEVHIRDAPKLLSFEYENKVEAYLPEKICLRILNIGTCQNLKTVEFVDAGIDDAILFELIPKLHFIKELILHFCECLTEIKISSSTLEVCSIAMCDLSAQAIFDTPKLLSLSFSNQHRLPSLSFVSSSSQCRISIEYHTIRDVEQLLHLRRSLVELRDEVVDLTLPSIINKDLRLASEIDHLPPPEIENLSSYCPDSTYSSYFDLIFSICWPKSLIIQYCDHDFGDFLSQVLLKERQWRFIECTWKEYFVNAEIQYKQRTRNNWMTLDRKMLAADPRIIEEMNTICFKQKREQ